MLLGPSYHKPVVVVPKKWPHQPIAQAANQPIALKDMAWWRQYHQTELNSLIETALQHNNDLHSALVNIDYAESQLMQVKLNWLPGMSVLAGYSQFPILANPGGFVLAAPLYVVNILQQYKQQKGAEQLVFASLYARDCAKLMIIAQVATSYFTLIAQLEALALYDTLLHDYQRYLNLAHSQYRFGLINAFVVANTRPVAALVNGYLTDIYVKNGAYVKCGQPLFTVFKKPYALAYEKASSEVNAAKARLIVLTKQVEKSKHLLKSKQDLYENVQFNHAHYQSALSQHAVSKLKVNTLLKERDAAFNEMAAYKKEWELNQQKMIVQKMQIDALTAIRDNAKVNLDETTVYAKNNGIVQNLFASLGTPINIREPIFSFIDTDTLFIQANFSEIDLRRVKQGDRVSIYPRIFMGAKKYHGVVVSTNWASSRQITDIRNQQQIVKNNVDHWILLPQRLPVQIQIHDYDPIHYPLSVGSSAYVYIHT